MYMALTNSKVKLVLMKDVLNNYVHAYKPDFNVWLQHNYVLKCNQLFICFPYTFLLR